MSREWIQISPVDNVIVALKPLPAGSKAAGISVTREIPFRHKIALNNIPKGENIIKYGYPIGKAKCDIVKGDHVHVHNISTALSTEEEYSYKPVSIPRIEGNCSEKSFMGFRREDGRVGTRNEIWIINTVGCVNKTAERLAADGQYKFNTLTDGIFTFVHPYGCSQLGEDHESTKQILLNLVKHPNAGGVLVLGLGCENNSVDDFKKELGEFDSERIKFLITQDVEDELAAGIQLIEELIGTIRKDKRELCSFSDLVVGMKCGGSDGFSGITANPLIGRFSDQLVSAGGTSILTEVPEMFGAERILMNRCRDENVFHNTVEMINDFKEYFVSHGQVIYENPSPGNKKGGITTLEEKSLGCIQKGGHALIEDILPYGGVVDKKGVVLLNGPGNDIVSTTALTAAGATVILFSTGVGTPLGAPIPTVKVSTNTELATRKKNWIDFDAGVLLENIEMDELSEKFSSFVADIASGKLTRNEINNYREIAIFKNGITL